MTENRQGNDEPLRARHDGLRDVTFGAENWPYSGVAGLTFKPNSPSPGGHVKQLGRSLSASQEPFAELHLD